MKPREEKGPQLSVLKGRPDGDRRPTRLRALMKTKYGVFQGLISLRNAQKGCCAMSAISPGFHFLQGVLPR